MLVAKLQIHYYCSGARFVLNDFQCISKNANRNLSSSSSSMVQRQQKMQIEWVCVLCCGCRHSMKCSFSRIPWIGVLCKQTCLSPMRSLFVAHWVKAIGILPYLVCVWNQYRIAFYVYSSNWMMWCKNRCRFLTKVQVTYYKRKNKHCEKPTTSNNNISKTCSKYTVNNLLLLPNQNQNIFPHVIRWQNR